MKNGGKLKTENNVYNGTYDDGNIDPKFLFYFFHSPKAFGIGVLDGLWLLYFNKITEKEW